MQQVSFSRIQDLRRVPCRRIGVLPGTALGSFLLHALLILPFVLGDSAARMRVPNVPGAGASEIVSSAEPMMTMIMIDAPAISRDPDALPEDIASLGLLSKSFAIKIISPDPLPAFDLKNLTTDQDAPNPVPEAAGEMAGRAQLFGRYMGQVSARIERAWIRPRNPIGDPLFRCKVQIKQDQRGNVLEVMIVQCNGDGDWQMSLANAVQSASPLPAPPDPSVFADALTLSFDSEPFHSGRSGEGFEPERVQVASAGSFSLGPATADILKRKPLPGVIEFRIIGKRDDSLNVAQPASLQVDPAADPGNVSNQGSLEPPPN